MRDQIGQDSIKHQEQFTRHQVQKRNGDALKILVMNDFGYVNGGASQVAVSEALTLAQAGFDVTFLYGVGPLDPRLGQQDNLTPLSVQVQDILTDPNRLRAGLQGLWRPKAAHLAAAWLEEQRKGEAIVHLHGWAKALTSSVVRTVLKYDIPLICTLHDYFSVCPNGGFYLYPKQALCTLQPLSIRCALQNCDSRSYSHKLWRLVRGMIQKTIGRLPSSGITFITISDFSRAILKPYLPAKSEMYLLPNPVDMPKMPPVPVGQNQSYTFVGRLSPEKGARILACANQSLGLRLVFVGDGPSRQEIEALAPQAKVTGWVDHRIVSKHLEKARALVFPSNVYETQGLAVMEAAARGVPAVVSDNCAARDFVRDGETGLWFKQGSVADLQKQLKRLQEDDLVDRLGQAAYERYWSDPATPQAHIQELMKIYQKTLDKHKKVKTQI